MGIKILSGNGDGFEADVNKDKRLLTSTENFQAIAIASAKGNAFFAHSGFVALTSVGVNNGILWIKNESSNKNFRIGRLVISGTMVQKWRVVKGATTGTLITAGTLAVPDNANFQSGTIFSGQMRRGADGLTVTDGKSISHWVNDVGTITFEWGGAVLLGTNDTISFECDPAVAGDVHVSVFGHSEDQES